jgi:hypothetical protein
MVRESRSQIDPWLASQSFWRASVGRMNWKAYTERRGPGFSTLEPFL